MAGDGFLREFIMDQIKLTGGIDLLGRLLLAALFLYDGWLVVNNYGAVAEYLAQFGVPPLLLVPALILQVVGGLLIVTGWNTRLAALALSLFCISTALIFRTQFGDPNEAIHFWKDLAIAGGFLVLAAHRPGAFSLDAYLRKATLPAAFGSAAPRRLMTLRAAHPFRRTCVSSQSGSCHDYT